MQLFSYAILKLNKFKRRINTDSSLAPVKIYSNADLQKQNIINENKNKSGIYQWVNILNGKTYIGSSVNLGRRLKQYYTYSYITSSQNKKMIIYKAILKYGYSNFSFKILEYCDISILIQREQFYFSLLKPEYNTLKNAGNTLGYRHTDETITKMSKIKIGQNNHFYGKIHSEEVKFKISQSKLGNTHSEVTKEKMSQAKGSTIYVYNLDYLLLFTFTSAKRTGEYFKSHHNTILKYARSREIFRKEYILSLEVLSPTST